MRICSLCTVKLLFKILGIKAASSFTLAVHISSQSSQLSNNHLKVLYIVR